MTKKRGAQHYQHGILEPIDYITANSLGFIEGNIIKYVTRYPYSQNPMQDMEKLLHYTEMLYEKVTKRPVGVSIQRKGDEPDCNCEKAKHAPVNAKPAYETPGDRKASERGSEQVVRARSFRCPRCGLTVDL